MRNIKFSPIIFLVAFIIGNADLNAQSQTDKYSQDTKSIQHLLDAYYDCISGPIGQKRDFERLKHLFHPDALLMYSYWNKEETKASTLIFKSLDAYIEKLDYLDKKGFYEHEISNTIDEFGSISQVFSTYTFRVEDKSVAPKTGITSYQILFDGLRYWIVSMFWTFESNQHKIPEKYLKK